jgi:aminopeptidase N
MNIKNTLLLLLILNLTFNTNIFSQKKCGNTFNKILIKRHPQQDTLDVISYNINLNITDFTNQRFRGFTDVKIRLKQSGATQIKLDLLEQTVDSVLFNNQNAIFSYNDSLLIINSASVLNTNDTITLRIFYSGGNKIDPSGWGGFYFSDSYAFNLGVGFRDIPHNYGRVWFPCVDNFTDRAFYTFNITTPQNFTADCNGSLENINDNGDGTRTFKWILHKPIPTYLASVAVGEYVAVTDTFNGLQSNIPISIYTSPGNETNTGLSFQNLKHTLSLFEDKFGPYRWERVGYVGVNFNSGAMEHATNIAYPESAIDGTLSNETLWAHELSHHWFGDLVTCKTAGDMWLNEGWASYCESIFKEGIYGHLAFKNYVRNNHYRVLRYTHNDDNGYFPVSGVPLNITYGSTVYEKGADVVHNLRYYTGDSLFFQAVKHYLEVMAFKDASSETLRDTLSEYTGIDLNGFFDNFVFQAGFPQYDLDSLRIVPSGNQYIAKVYIQLVSDFRIWIEI